MPPACPCSSLPQLFLGCEYFVTERLGSCDPVARVYTPRLCSRDLTPQVLLSHPLPSPFTFFSSFLCSTNNMNYNKAAVGAGPVYVPVTQNFGLIQVLYTDPTKSLSTNSFWLYNTVPSNLMPLVPGLVDNSNLIVNKDQLLTAFSLFVIAFAVLFWNFLVTWVGVATTREINLKLVYFVQLFSAVISTIAMIIGKWRHPSCVVPPTHPREKAL
jgi:hypothetical protein